jgi:hypothetical protein
MTSTDQAAAVFNKFKELHPNNKENFDPTLQNMMRWHYHIKEAEAKKQRQHIEINDDPQAQREESARAFKSFDEMPAYMQEKYLQLAMLFPGRVVYAAGSRVMGGYVEEWSTDAIRRMRKKLRKAPKVSSDYDIYIEPKDGEQVDELKNRLPEWADLLIRPEGSEKIKIPMWDFSRLPLSEHARAIQLYNEQRWGLLMRMHNDYQLSPETYCCNTEPVKKWFKYGIENGFIQQPSNQSKAESVDG